MKEIIILYDFLSEIGGLERVMFFQAKKLSKKHNVTLLFSHISEEQKNKIVKEYNLPKRVKIKKIGSFRNSILQFILSILFPKRIKKTKGDLIISHSFMSSRMAHSKKKMDGTPYVVVLHHPPNFLYSRDITWANNLPRVLAYLIGFFFGGYLKKLDKKAVRNADLILTNSNYTKKRVNKIYNRESTISYPPVSEKMKRINKTTAKKYTNKLNLDEKFALIHGRIIRDKRPDFAIEAISKIKGMNLAISGTIEDKENLIKLARQLGISHKIKILGRVSEKELLGLYNLASCFIMSAPKEDFGLTSVEALSCGCPVVSWKDGAGPQEIIREGFNGYLAKPYDIGDLAKKINKIIKKKWNKAKIEDSAKKFSERRLGKDFLALINKINF